MQRNNERGAGLSARQAKSLLSDGWRGLSGADEGGEEAAVLAWFEQHAGRV